jgi:DNA-binding FrmR family transcriptional regulator
MLDDDRDCHEIIQQLAAIKSAVHQASLVVVRSYAAQCLLEPHAGETREEIVEDLIAVLSRTS